MIKEVAILVYSTIIFPLLDYSDIAWSKFELHHDVDSLQRQQTTVCLEVLGDLIGGWPFF